MFSLKDLLDSENRADFAAAIEKPETAQIRKPIFTERRYNLTAFHRSGSVMKYEGISKAKATIESKKLRKAGFNRIDLIETECKVDDGKGNKIVLEFTEKNYQPKLEGTVPNPEPYLSNRMKDQRMRDRTKAAAIAAKNSKSKETRSKEMTRIYDKASGNLIFASAEEIEVANWLLRTQPKLSDIVMYLPSKVVAKLNKMGANNV